MVNFFSLQWDETDSLENQTTMVLILLQVQHFAVHWNSRRKQLPQAHGKKNLETKILSWQRTWENFIEDVETNFFFPKNLK